VKPVSYDVRNPSVVPYGARVPGALAGQQPRSPAIGVRAYRIPHGV
jgi:hypothetical protein